MNSSFVFCSILLYVIILDDAKVGIGYAKHGHCIEENEIFAEIFTFQNVFEVADNVFPCLHPPHFLHIGILSKEYSQEIQND
jgi:hypothetical protein